MPTTQMGCCCEDLSDAPSVCPCWSPPCGDLVTCYRVQGYMDGDFPSSSCTGASNSALPAWDGTFSNPTGTNCDWRGPTPPAVSIDGKLAATLSLTLELVPGPDYAWTVRITHSGTSTDPIYRKLTGQTPVGTYTKETDGSCSGFPSSIFIEEC